VLIGDALVNEDERLQARINQFIDKLEAALRQSLRIAQAANAWHGDAHADAAVLIAYVVGRWQLFAKSGFKRRRRTAGTCSASSCSDERPRTGAISLRRRRGVVDVRVCCAGARGEHALSDPRPRRCRVALAADVARLDADVADARARHRRSARSLGRRALRRNGPGGAGPALCAPRASPRRARALYVRRSRSPASSRCSRRCRNATRWIASPTGRRATSTTAYRCCCSRRRTARRGNDEAAIAYLEQAAREAADGRLRRRGALVFWDYVMALPSDVDRAAKAEAAAATRQTSRSRARRRSRGVRRRRRFPKRAAQPAPRRARARRARDDVLGARGGAAIAERAATDPADRARTRTLQRRTMRCVRAARRSISTRSRGAMSRRPRGPRPCSHRLGREACARRRRRAMVAACAQRARG
jgi:hypothetical protein